MAAISAGNLKLYLSGGAANAVQSASIGGARSTTTVATTAIFSDITGDQTSAGRTVYRCVYVRNEDANANGWISPYMWLSTGAPATGVAVTIGLGAAAKNGTESAVADETTAPAGVSFTAPTTKAGGIAVPTLSQNDFQAIWAKIVISAAAAAANVTFTLNIEGDTTA